MYSRVELCQNVAINVIETGSDNKTSRGRAIICLLAWMCHTFALSYVHIDVVIYSAYMKYRLVTKSVYTDDTRLRKTFARSEDETRET